MNFYQKYELERLIGDGETKTFRATENATGRAVYLHFFNPEGLGLLTALKLRFAKTPGKPELPLIELGEFAGTPYAVTLAIEQFASVRRWLDSLDGGAGRDTASLADLDLTVEIPKPSTPQPVSPTEPDKPAAPLDDSPGEFTRIFQQPDRSSAPQPEPPGEFTRMFELPKNAPASPSPKAQQAGEFTRMFGGTPTPSAPTPGPAEGGEFTRFFGGAPRQGGSPQEYRSSPQQPATPAADAGEFTQLFGARPAPARPEPPRMAEPPRPAPIVVNAQPPPTPEPAFPPSVPTWPASARSDDTGQFTKLFGSGPSGEAINIEEEQARAAKLAQPESRPFQAPTEFTRMFGPEEGAKLRPPAPLRADSASGIFGSMEEVRTAVPTKAAGPGEYTRVTSRAELEAEHAALGGTQPQAAAPVRRGLILGLAIGAILLLVLVIVILIVASKK